MNWSICTMKASNLHLIQLPASMHTDMHGWDLLHAPHIHVWLCGPWTSCSNFPTLGCMVILHQCHGCDQIHCHCIIWQQKCYKVCWCYYACVHYIETHTNLILRHDESIRVIYSVGSRLYMYKGYNMHSSFRNQTIFPKTKWPGLINYCNFVWWSGVCAYWHTVNAGAWEWEMAEDIQGLEE